MSKAMERRIEVLERRTDTLYQRTYARMRRRAEADEEMLRKAKKWAALLGENGAALRRMSYMMGRLQEGKTLVYLSPAEYRTLTWLLRRAGGGRRP